MKTYHIHDNGSRPFKVEDYGDKVSVYKKVYDRNDINDEGKYVHAFDKKYKHIFIGDDPLKISPYWNKSFKGNSILLELSKGKYMFIGWDIYEFSTTDEIMQYYSYVGNNDVPYPYAIGKTSSYLLIDKMQIKNEYIDVLSDLYGQYYNNKDVANKATKMKVKIVEKRIM